MDLQITDANGKITWNKMFFALIKGKQTINISNKLKLANGIYSFNFTFNGKYSAVEKVIIAD